MSILQTMYVNNAIPADQLVAAGDSPTLIGNTDITNSLYIGRTNLIIPGRQDSIQVTPQSWVVVDGTEDVFGITAGPTVIVNIIPGGLAFFQSGITGGGFTVNSNGAFFYDGAAGPGTLICAITGTGASGTDPYGNQYIPGGMCIVGQPQASSSFTVVDNASPPDLLASIGADGSFSTAGQLNAGSDLTVGGLSVPNDIIPPMPQGLIARTNVFASNLPAPATPTTAEFYLYELDVNLTAGRTYLLAIQNIGIALNLAGKVRLAVYATTDGTQPSNASPVILQGDMVAGGVTQNFTFRMPPLVKFIDPGTTALWRFLVSVNTVNTGAGLPTLQVVQVDTNPGVEGQVNARMAIYDMGTTVPNTGRMILAGSGGSGGGTQNYTKTYRSNGSHSYQGSDGGNPNLKINDNGRAYVCGDYPNTYNGKSKTWFTFNTGPITSDLAGATINWVKIYLTNNHTWYGSGMTAPVGYDSKSSFGSTAGDPSGGGIDAAETHFNQGQSKWFSVPNAFASNFASGAANTIVLWRNTNNLTYYGYFAGNDQCQMQVNYTK